jgi:hypothetical protein
MVYDMLRDGQQSGGTVVPGVQLHTAPDRLIFSLKVARWAVRSLEPHSNLSD